VAAQSDIEATAAAVEGLGAPDFYDRMLVMLGRAVRCDLAALVRYTRTGPPDMILPRIAPTPAMISYTRHFYAFDPFHLHWTETGTTGVFTLRQLSPGIGASLYAREFLAAMRIHDEIAVVLPPLGDAAPTLVLDRAEGLFSAAEVGRVRDLFPLLSALHRRHLGLLLTGGADSIGSPIGAERPLRIIDGAGHPIFATDAWRRRMAGGDLASQVARLADRGPCVMDLGGGEALRRTRLPEDFGTAPGGYCDEILAQPGPLPGPVLGALPPAMAAQLSPREQEVVRLTLRGFPVIEIARRMGLSRGTVKNYRAAIYRKLDITTERELFGEVLAGLGLAPGGVPGGETRALPGPGVFGER
jgi:DNA-binding CsgD family transcriptional regulator